MGIVLLINERLWWKGFEVKPILRMRNPGLRENELEYGTIEKKKYVINPRKQIPHFHYYLLGYHFRDGNNIEIYPFNLNLCCF